VRRLDLGPGVGAAFTDREGGVGVGPYATFNLAMHVGDRPDLVASNRQRLAELAGLPAQRLAWMSQPHGGAVAVLGGPPAAVVPGVDGLVTTAVGLGLVVLVADCVPVLLADPQAGVVGVAHAGWRGVRADVVGATVASMRAVGARRPRALVGPAVCARCYEVSTEVRAEVAAVVPVAASSTATGRPGLDLRAAVRGQLADAGVHEVDEVSDCTREVPAYFSVRRDGATGRFAGLVWLEPA
jgi:YfiH family protein